MTESRPEADLQILRDQRELANAIEFLCGFIVGKSAGFPLLIFAAWTRMLAPRPPLLDTATVLHFVHGTGLIIFSIAFLRFALPWIYARMPHRKPSRLPSRRTHVFIACFMASLLVGAFVAIAVAADLAPALMASVPFLMGVGSSLAWGGLRFRAGDEVVCSKCEYPRPDQPPAACPECANAWVLTRRFQMGRHTPNRRLIIAGASTIAVSIAAMILALSIAHP